ncbi:hypothetical protein GJ496_010555 [Pomphorhynchus laevis]|nr:hypothetical protein GJ496_010555 [Pomphorhynchus laevis]
MQKVFSTLSNMAPRKIAMILSGCGVYDGSEIYETTSLLIHLARKKADVSMFAPSTDQVQVINHASGEPMPETRNILIESARLARGQVNALANLQAADFDALVFPGGFGAAKNLSSFAMDGADMTVHEGIIRVVKEFYNSKKPMCFACISPIIACRLIKGCKVTFGMNDDEKQYPYTINTSQVANQFGARVESKDVNQVCIDQENMIISSPAFMKNTDIHSVYEGLGGLVDHLYTMLSQVNEPSAK